MDASTPRTRMRVEHSRTIKEGWGYSTTVEVQWDGIDDATALDRMLYLLDHARQLGEDERDRRNERDAR